MEKVKVIRNEGGSRVIAVTDVVPKDWQIITISVLKEAKGSIMLKVNKIK